MLFLYTILQQKAAIVRAICHRVKGKLRNLIVDQWIELIKWVFIFKNTPGRRHVILIIHHLDSCLSISCAKSRTKIKHLLMLFLYWELFNVNIIQRFYQNCYKALLISSNIYEQSSILTPASITLPLVINFFLLLL